MKLQFYVLQILLILILASCAATEESLTVNAQKKEPPFEQLYWGASTQIPNNMTIEQYQQTMKAYNNSPLYQQQNQLFHYILRATTWQEIDNASQKFLQQVQKDPAAFVIEPEIASSLLRSVFIYQNNDIEALKAIDGYMSVLQKRRYYSEPNLYVQILPKLEGYWSKQKIAQIAEECINANLNANVAIVANFKSYQSYFTSQARLEIQKERVTMQSSQTAIVSEISEEIIQQRTEKLKESFRKEIPNKIAQIKSKVSNQNEWFKTSVDALVILSMMAESSE